METADFALLPSVLDVDHIVLGVDAVAIVIERHVSRFTEDVACLQVVENPFAWRVVNWIS